MDAKGNNRLREIKLSIHINHIDKSKDKLLYKKLLKVLGCVALSISSESSNKLAELVRTSVCDGFARATHKELYAAINTFFGKYEAIGKLCTNGTTFYRKFGDVMNIDYINDDYLENLTPLFNDNVSFEMVNILNKFIDKFKMCRPLLNNKLEGRERTLELDFMLIYEKLLNIFNNINYVDKLIFNICNNFDIDYSTINHLKSHIHLINRSYPKFRYNNRYLTQEIVTLFTHRGYKKGTIGSKILDKETSYLFAKSRKNISKPIEEDELCWQYVPTIEWTGLSKLAVQRFIDIFQSFSDYNV